MANHLTGTTLSKHGKSLQNPPITSSWLFYTEVRAFGWSWSMNAQAVADVHHRIFYVILELFTSFSRPCCGINWDRSQEPFGSLIVHILKDSIMTELIWYLIYVSRKIKITSKVQKHWFDEILWFSRHSELFTLWNAVKSFGRFFFDVKSFYAISQTLEWGAKAVMDSLKSIWWMWLLSIYFL